MSLSHHFSPPHIHCLTNFFLCVSFFPPTSLHSLVLQFTWVSPYLTHLSLLPCCAKCLFICLSWVCLFGDHSEYILVKRQDKYQTVLKWSWQGKECHSYFTVYCATELLMPDSYILCAARGIILHTYFNQVKRAIVNQCHPGNDTTSWSLYLSIQ